MKKRDTAMLFSTAALLGGIYWLIQNKKGFWWYILLLFIISPAFGRIGLAIGKEDKEGKLDCDEKGGEWSYGMCWE